jgi:hypothetical protein
MKHVNLLIWLHKLILTLYPADFRDHFGDEMQAIFRQVMIEHTNDGKVLIPFLRELKDLPGSLIRQYWAVTQTIIRKENTTIDAISSSNDDQSRDSDRQPITWRMTFLAGLPHLIMGMLIGVGKLGILEVYQVEETSNPIIGISLSLLVISILIFAWLRSWPLWSASWFFYGTWVSFGVIALTIENLNLEDSWRYTNILFLIWITICILGYFLLLAKSKMYGLLSVACLFPLLSITLFEFIPNPIEGWFAIGVGLLSAFTAGMIIRVGIFRNALAIVLGLNITVGLTWAYISEYKMLDLPSGIPAHIPRFLSFLQYLAVYSIFGIGVIAIPFLLRGLWYFGKRKLTS